VGDKGIAKTQVARFVMGLYGRDPIIVSIKGDTSTRDLIGKPQNDSNAAIVYPEGPLIAAMREGVPILLDEINFGNQAVIARLHDILLRRPHDNVYFPELGYSVEIQPGFMIFATANEASSRYRQRQHLDPALRDRFEILVRTYPDLDCDVTADTFYTLTRMAYAYATDTEGILSRHIDPELLDKFVKVSAITERLYVLDAKDIKKHVPESVLTEGTNKPLIEDCISPRTLCHVVEDSALGNLPGRNLDLFLIDNIIKTLDQDGTAHNANIVRSVCESSGIDLFDRTKQEDDAPEDENQLLSM
jgi:MoxR-like ATPase